MKLYNSLNRQSEEFKPIKSGEVKLYTCGPTVYGFYHIGNLRNAIFNDTLRRTLEATGFEVCHVMNITDVGHLTSDADEGEDKLEQGAKTENKTVWEVAEFYTDAFKHDMTALKVLPPNGYMSKKYHDNYARATQFIAEQIDLVKQLIEKGFAYQTEQAIYFDVAKLADYGVLTGQRLSDKETAARSEVVKDPDKHHPYDFAVWFFTVGHFSGHTMHWPSPWGEGFPGWHLECSAIIHATLGDPIDIHTGGIDHIGTHHPNEMAQTEAAYGNKLAKFWVHNEWLLVDGAKMSKSKNNLFTLNDLTERGFDPLAFRLMALQAHYRSEINFSWESLTAAQSRLESFYALADRIHQLDPDKASSEAGAKLKAAETAVVTALRDNLDTPTALRIISELIDDLDNQVLTESDRHDLSHFLGTVDSLLGLGLTDRPDIDKTAKELIQRRQAARAKSEFNAADQIRGQLLKQEIGLNDTPGGTRWFRKLEAQL